MKSTLIEGESSVFLLRARDDFHGLRLLALICRRVATDANSFHFSNLSFLRLELTYSTGVELMPFSSAFRKKR